MDFAGEDYIEEVHHLLQVVHLESPDNVVEKLQALQQMVDARWD